MVFALRDGGQVGIEASLKMLSLPRHDQLSIKRSRFAVVVAICAFMAFKLFVFVFVFKIIGLL